MNDASRGAVVPGLALASLTDVGRVRTNNEDAIGDPLLLAPLVGPPARLESRGVLLAVADGMGGHVAGEVASRLAVEALFGSYYAADGSPPEDLGRAVRAANDAVLHGGPETERDAPGRHSAARMGTTLVAAAIVGGEVHVANVGDSRAYRLHGGELAQITRDHSLVAEEVRAGILSEAAARTFPYRNVLTQAIGAPEILVDLFTLPWLPGDRLLLCSDGLHGVVPDDLVREALAGLPPEDAARALVRVANARGGPDNVSVVIAEHLQP